MNNRALINPLRYDAALARAHRQLWNAENVGRDIGEEGSADDLYEMRRHLEAIQTAWLKRGGHLRTRP